MREKGEILSKVLSNIDKAPVETRPMLYHEYIVVEVLVDIRDILAADMKTSLEISKAMSKKERS